MRTNFFQLTTRNGYCALIMAADVEAQLYPVNSVFVYTREV